MKAKDLAISFLQKTKPSVQLPVPAQGTINAFHALFSVQELNPFEQQTIETILEEGAAVSSPRQQVEEDLYEIKRLTKELRAIRRQELVLIGERVSAAREVLKKYKDRSFRDWLQLTFGSFKTGYNYLAFYDLYVSVPDDMKMHLKDMPAKAVYILASHKAPLEKKLELLRHHSQKTAHGVIAAIREMLGGSDLLSRKKSNEQLISLLEKNAVLLSVEYVDAKQRDRLISLIDHLNDLVELSHKYT